MCSTVTNQIRPLRIYEQDKVFTSKTCDSDRFDPRLIHRSVYCSTHRPTVKSAKAQVSEVEKITWFDPLLYGKDYRAKAVTFLKYIYLVK